MAALATIHDRLGAHALGAWLETLRLAKDWSQGDLMQALRGEPYRRKTHIKDIYFYETGQRVPNAFILADLNNVLDGNAEVTHSLLGYGTAIKKHMIDPKHLQHDGEPIDQRDEQTIQHLVDDARLHGARMAKDWVRVREQAHILQESATVVSPEVYDHTRVILIGLQQVSPDRVREFLNFGEYLLSLLRSQITS